MSEQKPSRRDMLKTAAVAVIGGPSALIAAAPGGLRAAADALAQVTEAYAQKEFQYDEMDLPLYSLLRVLNMPQGNTNGHGVPGDGKPPVNAASAVDTLQDALRKKWFVYESGVLLLKEMRGRITGDAGLRGVLERVARAALPKASEREMQQVIRNLATSQLEKPLPGGTLAYAQEGKVRDLLLDLACADAGRNSEQRTSIVQPEPGDFVPHMREELHRQGLKGEDCSRFFFNLYQITSEGIFSDENLPTGRNILQMKICDAEQVVKMLCDAVPRALPDTLPAAERARNLQTLAEGARKILTEQLRLDPKQMAKHYHDRPDRNPFRALEEFEKTAYATPPATHYVPDDNMHVRLLQLEKGFGPYAKER